MACLFRCFLIAGLQVVVVAFRDEDFGNSNMQPREWAFCNASNSIRIEAEVS